MKSFAILVSDHRAKDGEARTEPLLTLLPAFLQWPRRAQYLADLTNGLPQSEISQLCRFEQVIPTKMYFLVMRQSV